MAILLSGWAVTLVVVGLGLWIEPAMAGEGGIQPAPLLAGGAILLAIGLGLLLWTADRPAGRRKGFRLIRWVSAASAFGGLAWGIWGRDPQRQPIVLAIVVLGALVSNLAYWLERRTLGPRRGR